MILSIYSSLAEEESRSISTNIRWAQDKRVERGEVVFNFKNLYGYTQDEERNVSILEDEAAVVRDIYHKYIIGYSIAELCRELTAQGVASPYGNDRWHFSTIEKMLENEKYAGDVILRKTYQRDFLAERRVKNTGQAPQKYVDNNHPAIIDRATWNAVQAEIERRGNIRTSEETGKGRYDMRYVFSGLIECGDCGAKFRRHNYTYKGRVERVWTCKEHIRGNKHCPQLPIKEGLLEQAFTRTFNGLLADRNKALKAVEESVTEAMYEVGDGTGTAEEITTVDAEIERLQAKMIDLNKQRARREIDGEVYNQSTQEVKEQLDGLFEKRDDLAEAQSTGALSVARRKIITELLESEQARDEFDKDAFSKLIEVVRVYSREEIIFIFKDGSEVKADLGAEAA